MNDQKGTNQTLGSMLLRFCMENCPDTAQAHWLESQCSPNPDMPQFFLAFGLIAKKIARKNVTMPEALRENFEALNPDFSLTAWTLDELARLALLLTLDTQNNLLFIEKLVGSADRRELVLIYKAIPYLPNAEDFILLMADGIRTNMIDVFDAIVLHNPFGFRYFDEASWNQMVLKAIFMERPVYKIVGIDERKNEKLAGILHNFVHERWSAGRLVTPELWRMFDSFANTEILRDLRLELDKGNELAKTAVSKILLQTFDNEEHEWLQTHKDSVAKTSWNEIGQSLEGLQQTV